MASARGDGDFTRLGELVPSAHREVNVCGAVRAVLHQGLVACRRGSTALSLVKLADESDPAGITSLKLWGRRAEWAKEVLLKAGDVVLLTRAVASQWRDAPIELAVRSESALRVIDPQTAAGLPARISAVLSWALSSRSYLTCAPDKDGHAGRDGAGHELLVHGASGAPLPCGAVCGGACDFVRNRQTKVGEAIGNASNASPSALPSNMFQSVDQLLCSTGPLGVSRRVSVCGILVLDQKGDAACKAAIDGHPPQLISGLLSSGGRRNLSVRDGEDSDLLCRIKVLGQQPATLVANFFRELNLRKSGSPWTTECLLQVWYEGSGFRV